MKCLVADVALKRLLARVRESVVLVVSLLVESLAAELADPRPVALVDPHVGVEGRTTVERLAAGSALVGLLVSVDDLVAAEGRGLTETLAANLAHERTGACGYEERLDLFFSLSRLYRRQRERKKRRTYSNFWQAIGLQIYHENEHCAMHIGRL